MLNQKLSQQQKSEKAYNVAHTDVTGLGGKGYVQGEALLLGPLEMLCFLPQRPLEEYSASKVFCGSAPQPWMSPTSEETPSLSEPHYTTSLSLGKGGLGLVGLNALQMCKLQVPTPGWENQCS